MTTSTFLRANVKTATAATRTQLYQCPAATTAVIFDGQITNIDSTTKASHYVTMEIYNGSTYHIVFKELEVPYGLASSIPKMVLTANEYLYVTCDDASGTALEAGAQVIQRA